MLPEGYLYQSRGEAANARTSVAPWRIAPQSRKHILCLKAIV